MGYIDKKVKVTVVESAFLKDIPPLKETLSEVEKQFKTEPF